MLRRKTYRLERSDGNVLVAKVVEVLDKDLCIFVYPCALVLSAYLATTQFVNNTKVVELGAGTGLPSIICALLGAESVLVTERENEDNALTNLQRTIEINHVENICKVWPLNWGVLKEDIVPFVDIILGADIFYSSEDYDKVLTTVACFMCVNTAATFLVTFQDRG